MPGIITSDWREIFEEQSVVSSLAEAGGTVAGALDAVEGRGRVPSVGHGGGTGRAGGRVCFAEEDKMFNFGRCEQEPGRGFSELPFLSCSENMAPEGRISMTWRRDLIELAYVHPSIHR